VIGTKVFHIKAPFLFPQGGKINSLGWAFYLSVYNLEASSKPLRQLAEGLKKANLSNLQP
jgi:hypothetical protein